MKLLSSALFITAVAAAAAPSPQQQQQHVLKDAAAAGPQATAADHGAWQEQVQKLAESIRSMIDGGDASTVLQQIKARFPQLEQMAAPPPRGPKPHTRRPDDYWDSITRGADLQSVWVENAAGEKERQIDGKLEPYSLRSRAVDPGKLGVDPGVKQYSGYLDDDENDKHLFYWFFESRNDPKNDPVVLWLNGGPGCSSLTGLFLELGPATVDEKLQLHHNPYSWNANASVLFLDQPINVGFSYSGSDSVSSTAAAAKDVYALLTLFFAQFPQYARQPFHIAGESYAGHYVPVFAAEILAHRRRNINLQSLLIGNGLTDELVQYQYYRPMACGDGGWPAVLDAPQCRAMDNALPRCLSLIRACYASESAWACVPAAVYCNSALLSPFQSTGRNVYDVREACRDSENLCYPQLGWIGRFLNQRRVQEALGAEVASYETCNMGINRNFVMHGDWMLPIHRLVPGLLAQMPVLVYAGDADFICNWLGNLAWTEALEWPGQAAYNAAPIGNLTLSRDIFNPSPSSSAGSSRREGQKAADAKAGEVVGAIKSHGNFTFVKIHAGGHMVPYDQPRASLDMLNRWLGGEWREGSDKGGKKGSRKD